MKLSAHTTYLSHARLRRYTESCNNDKDNTIKLYKLNIKLSQRIYAHLGVFEVVLRNKIDARLQYYFKSNNYLLQELGDAGSFLNISHKKNYHKEALNKTISDLRKANKPIIHDRLIASLCFGFWTELFGKYTYNALNSNLIHVFHKKAHGTTRSIILNHLNTIRKQRNRIAHHEPLCLSFDKTTVPWISFIDVSEVEKLMANIDLLYQYMDVDPTLLEEGLPDPMTIIEEIKSIKDMI